MYWMLWNVDVKINTRNVNTFLLQPLIFLQRRQKEYVKIKQNNITNKNNKGKLQSTTSVSSCVAYIN